MNTKLVTGIGVALAMAGCASTPPSYPALDTARTTVQSAEADPNVAKYAALDLEKAQQELKAAEAAALRHDREAIDQPAYLATQTARLAELRATAKADDARVAAGQSERDRIQLAARTRQVEAEKMAREQEAQKAAALQAEVDALKAKPTDRGLVLTLGDVLFDTGRAELNPGAQPRFAGDVPDRSSRSAHRNRWLYRQRGIGFLQSRSVRAPSGRGQIHVGFSGYRSVADRHGRLRQGICGGEQLGFRRPAAQSARGSRDRRRGRRARRGAKPVLIG